MAITRESRDVKDKRTSWVLYIRAIINEDDFISFVSGRHEADDFLMKLFKGCGFI